MHMAYRSMTSHMYPCGHDEGCVHDEGLHVAMMRCLVCWAPKSPICSVMCVVCYHWLRLYMCRDDLVGVLSLAAFVVMICCMYFCWHMCFVLCDNHVVWDLECTEISHQSECPHARVTNSKLKRVWLIWGLSPQYAHLHTQSTSGVCPFPVDHSNSAVACCSTCACKWRGRVIMRSWAAHPLSLFIQISYTLGEYMYIVIY